MRIGRLNATSGRGLFVFPGTGQGLSDFHYLVDPIRRCTSEHFSFADPVTHLRPVVGFG
jgi:hypothetical protein